MRVFRGLALLTMIILFGSVLTPLNQGVGMEGPRAGPITMAKMNVHMTYLNGSPAVGMKVYVYNKDSSFDWTESYGTTDASGDVAIDIKSDDLGPGYIHSRNNTGALWVREEVYIEPGKTYDRDLVLKEALPRSYTIEGTVRYRSNETLVQGAYFEVYGSDLEGRPFNSNGLTGADGKFSVNVAMSDYQYQVYVAKTGVIAYSNTVYLNRSVTKYDLVIKLKADPSSIPLNLKIIDDTTGDPILYPDVSVYGIKAYDDHNYFSNWFWGLPGTGWVNSTLGRGNYFYDVGTYIGYGNGTVTQYATVGIVMNDTPISREVRLPVVHEFRNLSLEVKEKGTGTPLSAVFIGSDHIIVPGEEFDTRISFNGATGMDGKGLFPLLPMTDYYFHISPYGYKGQTVLVPAGPITEEVNLTVELEKDDIVTPGTGTISILVKDQITDRPLPKYSVEGNGEYNFWGQTDLNGYFNQTVTAVKYERISAYGALGRGSIEGVTLNSGGTLSLTVLITERAQFSPQKVQYSFRAVDEEGTPLPNLFIPFVQLYDFGYDSYFTTSDENGMVRVTVPEGIYTILSAGIPDTTTGTRLSYVSREGLRITVPETGGIGPDITFYPTRPFTEVTGAVKDLGTGKAIRQAGIRFQTGKDLEGSGPVDLMVPMDVIYQDQTSYSMADGYYRLWGKDTLTYYVTKKGYYPETGAIDLTTRALNRDIYLERLLPYTTFINGTIVDYLGAPEKGYVTVMDIDRDYYTLNEIATGPDGKFSIGVYPGHFLISYSNDTIHEQMEVEVDEDGVEDLLLVLTPESDLYGTVVDWSGAPIAGINVDVLNRTGLFEETLVTGDLGNFSIALPPGEYNVLVQGYELYDEYGSGFFTMNGFTDKELNIILSNRSKGNVYGKVLGDGPSGQVEIVDAVVVVWDQGRTASWSSPTWTGGGYNVINVPFGTNYTMEIRPPSDLRPDPAMHRSGFLDGAFGPFNLTSMALNVEVLLEYQENLPPGYYNITSYSPTGDDVFLNEPIVVQFSHSMNRSTLEGNLTISPEPNGLTFEWLDDNKTLAIDHDVFEMNTTYTVKVLGTLLSMEGFMLYNGTYLEWNFTTGTEEMTWWLDSKDVEVASDRTVTVTVTGAEGITVYIVIEGLGSDLLAEGPNGTYSGVIGGTLLEWDTEYSYHFSDSENGTDKAPMLSGTFRTPVEPVEWEILSASVELDDDGNWKVEVTANEGLDIWIVIDGIGSFKLIETQPGKYSTTIAADRFEEGKEYDYWFSDSDGGSDKAPAFSDSLKAKKGEGGDDVNYLWVYCLGIAFLVVLVLIIVVVVIITRKGKGKEEEAESWGEE